MAVIATASRSAMAVTTGPNPGCPGATVTSATVDATDDRFVVEAPGTTDVRDVVEHVRNELPDAELVATGERDCEIDTVGRPGGVLDDLTERQHEVLEAAYRAGCYAWPRESTAEEVAADLDLTRPTLHGHLRKAERALLSRLLMELHTVAFDTGSTSIGRRRASDRVPTFDRCYRPLPVGEVTALPVSGPNGPP